MTSDNKKSRRRYSQAQKAQVLAECDEPGASVAKVAMAHGINANIVHRWRQLSRDAAPAGPAKASGFVALSLPAPEVPPAVATDVRVELRRGAVVINVTWPISGAAELAEWTRELLR